MLWFFAPPLIYLYAMHKEILRLAIPNILTNLTVPLLGAVDTALMGHLAAPGYLAALGVGVAVFNFVYWGFGFLRMSTTGFVAQAVGRSDRSSMRVILFRGLLLAAGIGMVLILLQDVIWAFGLWIVQPEPHVATLAGEYFAIRIWAAPANLMLMVLLGWLLGAQNAGYPLLISLAGNVINIALSFYLVTVEGYTIAGVAIGTLVAQYAGLMVALLVLLVKYKVYIQWPGIARILDREQVRSFVVVNRDIFLRTLCLMFVFTFMTAQSARFGTEILALNTVLLQLISIVSYGIDGLAFASESLTGKYLGKGISQPLRKMIRYLFVWGFGLALILSVGFLFFRDPIMRIFTDHAPILRLAKAFAWWIVLAPLVNNFAYLWDGIYLGATASKPMRNSMFYATVLVFVPVFYIANYWYDNHALWLAFTLFMIARGSMLWWWADRNLFRPIREGSERNLVR